MQQTELLPVPLIWSLPSQAAGVYLSLSWCVTEQCVSVSPNPSYKIGADFCLLDKCSLSNQNTHQGPHTAFPAVKSALVMLAWKSGWARAWEPWNHLKDLNSTKEFKITTVSLWLVTRVAIRKFTIAFQLSTARHTHTFVVAISPAKSDAR